MYNGLETTKVIKFLVTMAMFVFNKHAQTQGKKLS